MISQTLANDASDAGRPGEQSSSATFILILANAVRVASLFSLPRIRSPSSRRHDFPFSRACTRFARRPRTRCRAGPQTRAARGLDFKEISASIKT